MTAASSVEAGRANVGKSWRDTKGVEHPGTSIVPPVLEAFTSAPVLHGRVLQLYKVCPSLFQLFEKAKAAGTELTLLPTAATVEPDDHLMAAIREVARQG
jgi:hypothetical protein